MVPVWMVGYGEPVHRNSWAGRLLTISAGTSEVAGDPKPRTLNRSETSTKADDAIWTGAVPARMRAVRSVRDAPLRPRLGGSGGWVSNVEAETVHARDRWRGLVSGRSGRGSRTDSRDIGIDHWQNFTTTRSETTGANRTVNNMHFSPRRFSARCNAPWRAMSRATH